jgi:hypothetical protein
MTAEPRTLDGDAFPQELAALDPGVLDSSILTAYRGSRAHGTWVDAGDPNSIADLDVMAFCVPPESYYLGLDQYGSGGTKEIKHNEWDTETDIPNVTDNSAGSALQVIGTSTLTGAVPHLGVAEILLHHEAKIDASVT